MEEPVPGRPQDVYKRQLAQDAGTANEEYTNKVTSKALGMDSAQEMCIRDRCVYTELQYINDYYK